MPSLPPNGTGGSVRRGCRSTDDAYLQADLTPLAARVPGYVRRVLVNDFQRVKAGDLLVEIEDDDYRAQVRQAEGNAANAEVAIATIEQQKALQKALIAQAEAMVAASEADLTRYHLETVRQQALLATGIAGTRQTVEQAVDSEKRAEATLALNFAQLDQQRRQVNVLDSQEKQAQATLPCNRRRVIWRRSTLATRASPRRWTAWSASARCRPASISVPARR